MKVGGVDEAEFHRRMLGIASDIVETIGRGAGSRRHTLEVSTGAANSAKRGRDEGRPAQRSRAPLRGER
jgi:hypothetical protein